jgi:hypothetical protein
MKHTLILSTLFLCLATTLNAQKTYYPESSDYDKSTLGIGIGFDYGGIGLNYTVYPQENIGLFGSVGYAIAGAGYNFGVKLRANPNRFTPFFMAMYGYNAAIAVSGNTGGMNLDKLFYGPTLGGGFDLKSRGGKGYFSFALTVPIRNQDADNYMQELTNTYGITFGNKLSPVGFSFGYRFILF